MTAGKSQMEKEISVFGHSNMRVSIRKGKIFHQDLVFAARQSSTFLSQTQNQLYVALKMTFQMLYLAISLLRLDIFLRKKKKKKALGNQFPWHSPTPKAGRKMERLGMVSTGTQTDTHTFRARPHLLSVHSLPGPAEGIQHPWSCPVLSASRNSRTNWSHSAQPHILYLRKDKKIHPKLFQTFLGIGALGD